MNNIVSRADNESVMKLTSAIHVNNSPANGTDYNAILFAVTRNEVPCPGQFIHFSVYSPSGNATLPSPYAETDSNGNFLLKLTNTVAEDVLIVAAPAISDAFNSTSDTLKFSQVEELYNIQVTTLVNKSAADGTSQNKVQLKINNALNKPVTNKLVQFLPSTGLTLRDRFVLTDSDGVAAVSCTALAEGDYFISAEIYGENVVQAITGISFTKSSELSGLSGYVLNNTLQVSADGVEYWEIVYFLKKSARDINANKEISIVLNSVTAYPSKRTIITDDTGMATLYVYNTVAESVVVSAYADNDNLVARNKIVFSS